MTYSGAGVAFGFDRKSEAKDSLAGLSFDDVLGPGKERYLAEGYARIDRGFTKGYLEIAAGQVTASAMGFAAYPADWSVKASERLQRPHLSSIDAIVLAERLVERALFALSLVAGNTSCASWTYEVELRAGAKSDQDVGRIPMQCTITSSMGTSDVVAECHIGAMRVRLGVRLSPGDPRLEVLRNRFLRIPLAGEPTVQLPATTWSTCLEPISSSSNVLGARHAGRSMTPSCNVGGQREPVVGAVSYIDLLRLSAQQAQALIYSRDGVTRQAAESLWMRKARFTATSPDRALPTVFDMQLAVVKESHLVRGERPWRLFDVEASGVPFMHASASLAYVSG